MTDTVSQLKTIVDEVARSGALTPAAIKQFDELKTRLEQAEKELLAARTARDMWEADVKRLREAVLARDKDLKDTRDKLETLETRRFEFTLQERLYQSQIERRVEMRSIVSEVFRNFEAVKMLSRGEMVPPAYPGGSPTLQYLTDTETLRNQPGNP